MKGVKASGTIEKSGQPISFQYYQSSADKLLKSTALGHWIDILPSDSDIEIGIVNPCLENVETHSIITSDQDINEVINVGPAVLLQDIETTIINCQGAEVDVSALVVTEAGRDFFYQFGNSEIMATVPVCNNEFTIAAYDINTGQQGLSFPWKNNIGDEVAFLNTCTDFADGYSYFKINDDPKIYSAFTFQLVDGNITLTSNTNDPEFKLLIGGNGKGSYDEMNVNIKIYDEGFGPNGYAVNCEESELISNPRNSNPKINS